MGLALPFALGAYAPLWLALRPHQVRGPSLRGLGSLRGLTPQLEHTHRGRWHPDTTTKRNIPTGRVQRSISASRLAPGSPAMHL